MANSITPREIKQKNKKLIYQYIYNEKSVSQQNICNDLRLSRPTVTNNLNELEADGAIIKAGPMDSEVVGRKAMAYRIVPDYRVSIGVEIVRKEIKMMALDLYGERIDRVAIDLPFALTEEYRRQVCTHILAFINKLQFSEAQILGICFSLPGLVSPDGQAVIYGKILNCTGLRVEDFSRYLPYPCRFIHDAESAATAELWNRPTLTDAYFVSLSKHIGGAIIRNRQIIIGKHGHNATFEHICIRPGSTKQCYCGKYGCIDTICSIHDLLQDGEELDDFFVKKGNGDAGVLHRWNDFLCNLGEALNLIHLIYDTDIILGGFLAPHLTEDDLEKLYIRIDELNPFPEEKDFLTISKMPKHSITIGGALIMIQEFLDLIYC